MPKRLKINITKMRYFVVSICVIVVLLIFAAILFFVLSGDNQDNSPQSSDRRKNNSQQTKLDYKMAKNEAIKIKQTISAKGQAYSGCNWKKDSPRTSHFYQIHCKKYGLVIYGADSTSHARKFADVLAKQLKQNNVSTYMVVGKKWIVNTMTPKDMNQVWGLTGSKAQRINVKTYDLNTKSL